VQKAKVKMQDRNHGLTRVNTVLIRVHPWFLPVAAILILAGCAARAKPGTKPTVPDFTLSALDGKQVQLSAQRGKPVVLSFWSSSDPACRLALPGLESLYLRYKDRNVAFLGVALVDPQDSIEELVQADSVGFPVLLGNDSVAKAYSVELMPAYEVVDANGYQAFRGVGYDPDSGLADMDHVLNKLASKKKQ
jgi:peroxiredoxin